MMYKAVVIGVSSGGLNALKILLPALPAGFPLPLIVVQHVGAQSGTYWVDALDSICQLRVKEADEKEEIEPGTVYIAPPNYHLLVEKDETFSLTVDERVNYARPSIDVLFESAAEAYREKLVGIVLTGANHDGAAGLKKIKELGGIAIVQDPATAESPVMPEAARKAAQPDHLLPIEKMPALLLQLSTPKHNPI